MMYKSSVGYNYFEIYIFSLDIFHNNKNDICLINHNIKYVKIPISIKHNFFKARKLNRIWTCKSYNASFNNNKGTI